jgi:hypothetical protein
MAHPKNARQVVLSLLVVASSFSLTRADEVTYWNRVALDIAKETATAPPLVSRDLAIVHAAIYDALNAIDATYEPLYYRPTVMGPVSREAAVAAAAHEALVGLYPGYEMQLNDLLGARLSGLPDGTAQNNGVALGRSVADNMLALRASDGWDRTVVYPGGTAPGQWRPTPPGYQPAVAPQWGDVRPFGIVRSDVYVPGPPPALTSPEYAAAVNEVKRLGSINSTARTPDQTQIAEFWSDYPGATASPVGKWNLIAQTLAGQQGNTLAENARMFALLNVSLADAGIVCWDTKYTYGLWRPIDAIRLADTDGNPATPVDPEWTPMLPSPAFPEYVSGHSTFSGAAAEVLALFFGTDDIAFETEAGFDVLPGVARSYDSLSDAALEAGRSRIYGGIHFEFSNVTGRECGIAIADYVFDNYAQPVPAPGAALLALIGAAGLLRWRRAFPG